MDRRFRLRWPGVADFDRFHQFGNGGADTLTRTLSPDEYQRTWYKQNPPLPRAKWSQRNNNNYEQTALLISLDYFNKNSKLFLKNFYLKSKRSIGLTRSMAYHAELQHLVAEMGVSQVVYGTDNPLNWPVPVEMIVNHSTLTNDQKVQILSGNLMKLLKITSTATA